MYVVSPRVFSFRELEQSIKEGKQEYLVHVQASLMRQSEPINGSLIVDLENGDRAAVQIADGRVTYVEHQVPVNRNIVLGKSTLPKGEKDD